MNQPLLSVIVPCYNVAPYIDRCIASIAGQTYRNLEIILIDDGSTDRTGALCDAWQEKDRRIKVIHRENAGPSCARQTGVEAVTGEYITFVDADDWIDEKMYVNMMAALLSTNSDIAQCGFCEVSEAGSIQHRSSKNKDGSFEIVDRTKGVLLIIESKEWQSYLWNKMYKKHLFDHIEFPKGRGLNEDTTIMHVLFHHAEQTVFLHNEYCFYCRRSGSITKANRFASKMKNIYDTYQAFYERYCFVEQHPEYHQCLIHAKNNAVSRGIRALRYSIIYPQYFPDGFSDVVFKQLQTMQFTLKEMNNKFFTALMGAEIYLFLCSPAWYKRFVMLYTKIKTTKS